MTSEYSSNQLECKHIWSSEYDWRCPKCGMHMQSFVQLKRKEEINNLKQKEGEK